MAADQPNEQKLFGSVAFARPRFLSFATFWPTLIAAIVHAINYVTVRGTLLRPGFVRTEAVVVAIVTLSQLLIVARAQRKGPFAVTVSAACMTLPRGALSSRLVTLPLERVRSVVMVGRGWRARLVVDAGRRTVSSPVRSFDAPDALGRVRAALRGAMLAAPDGKARWAAIEQRHALSDAIGHVRPVATWCAVTVLVAAFVVQSVALLWADPFRWIDLGANVPILLSADEWFRLVTANLLHQNARHLGGNAFFLLVVGTVLERLVGLRRALLVMLATGIAAQLAAAWLANAMPFHIYSVGASGALYGVFGTLATLSFRYRRDLSAGLRLPARFWALVLILSLAPLATTDSGIDVVGHAGGFAAGVALGAVIAASSSAIALHRESVAVDAVCAALLLLWGAGVGVGVLRFMDPAQHVADRATLAHGLLAEPKSPPWIDNALAWTMATNSTAGPPALRDAAELAKRAVASATRRDPNGANLAAYADTLAALDYRLGDAGAALRREYSLIARSGPFADHFAVFLDREHRDHGFQVMGDRGPTSARLAVANGALQLIVAQPNDKGAVLYALVRHNGGLIGLITVDVPPRFTGAQALGPSFMYADTVAASWTDPLTEVELAMIDRRGCFCSTPGLASYYRAISTADLPMAVP